MKHQLKLTEIIYKRLIKGPACVERGSDRKCLCIALLLNSDVFLFSNTIPILSIFLTLFSSDVSALLFDLVVLY
jgi:hypothetical protein